MRTRLLAAAAFAVVGGALAVTPATAGADAGAGTAQVTVGQASGQASVSAVKVRRFEFRRGWGDAWGTKSTKVVKGRLG